MALETAYERRVEPLAMDWRHAAWSTGAFDTARRPYSAAAEGTFCMPQHLVLVTLQGGARHQEVVSSCGHRFSGPDRPGNVSFVPAHCSRQLKLSGVESVWASIALDPAVLNDEDLCGPRARSLEGSTFSNSEDRFLLGMAGEFAQLYATDGRLDPTYCDHMSWSLARYLLRRYGRAGDCGGTHSQRLPAWRLRRIADYVEDHLDGEIRIADLATLVGVSAGYLHRAFRDSTGLTPLSFINERRVRRAMRILETERASMVEIALRIGFVSASHFTRTFRSVVGISPSRYRALIGPEVNSR